MRNIFAAFLILISLISYAQGNNPFLVENDDSVSSSSNEGNSGATYEQYNQTHITASDEDCDADGIPDEIDDQMDCAPNPADPVPINDYIPLLVIVALSMILLTAHKKKAME